MTRSDALRDLLAKVEAGSPGWRLPTVRRAIGARHREKLTLAFYGSLDAAKALHEAVLPGWSYLVGMRNVALSPPPTEAILGWVGSAKDPARSWLIAILKALIAQENDA